MIESLLVVAAMLTAVAAMFCAGQATEAWQHACAACVAFWAGMGVCLTACATCTILYCLGTRL